MVLSRTKLGKSASERIQGLLNDCMFSFLSDDEKSHLVIVLEGDSGKPLAGLSRLQLNFLCQEAKITHVFHLAANVSFALPLQQAASNISSALTMKSLSAHLNAKFIHMSTAFVHGGLAGSASQPLSQQLFPLEPYSPRKICESMMTTQYYASIAMRDLGFPNTYTFSKCVCEHLLADSTNIETIIFRPSIIGPSIENPYEGWSGSKPQALVAAASLYLSYQWNLWCFGAHHVPFIPVDVVSRFVLAKAVEQSQPSDIVTLSSDDDFERISKGSDASSLVSEHYQLDAQAVLGQSGMRKDRTSIFNVS